MRQTIGVSSSYRDVLRRDALDLSHRKQTEISISQDELAKLEYKFSRYLDSLPK